MTTEGEQSSSADAPSRQEAGPAARPPRSAWACSIRVYLLALMLVVLVPAFLFSAVVLIRTNEAQNRAFQSLFVSATHSVAELVDRDVSGMLATLRVLSSATSLSDSNLAQFHARANQALAGTGAYITVLDDKFDELLNTRLPFGAKLGKGDDIQSATEALKSGWPAVSNLFYDSDAGAWSFDVALPLKSDDFRAKVMVLTQRASDLSPILTGKQIPKGWQVSLVDGKRTVIASSAGQGSVGRAFYIPFDKGLNAGFTAVDYQGINYQIVVQPSDITGWSIVSWAPTKEVRRPLNQSIAWLVFGGLVIAALAGTGAFLIARIMNGSVHGLVGDARNLGAGETIEPRDHAIIEFGLVSAALARAARDRRNAENEVRFLMREVAHRSKNQLTVIQAMLNQTAKLSGSKAEFAESFRKRISGLARSTDLMMTNATQGVDLGALVADQIESFRPSDPTRVHIKGPEVRLDSQAAQVMGMAVHELATNAAKYGAFSGVDGVLDVSWSVADERVRVVWREKGVALGELPDRKGFGSIVLERILGISLGAELERVVHPDGIEWTFTIPLDKLQDGFDRRI